MNKPIHPAVAEHVMEENKRLRGLLQGAHDTIRNLAEDLDEEEFQATIDQLAEIELALAPQQAEPVRSPGTEDAATMLANGSQEAAPAQDEREEPQVVARIHESPATLFPATELTELGVRVTGTHDLMTVAQHERIVAALTRPAQTEQQPINVTAVAVTRENEEGELYLDWLLEGGICELEFAGQVLVWADQPITDDEGHGEVYAAPIEQTAPQPEQSVMVEMVDRAMLEMQNIHPPMRRSDCERLIRAALSAQGGRDE